jgi:hypothetical protein
MIHLSHPKTRIPRTNKESPYSRNFTKSQLLKCREKAYHPKLPQNQQKIHTKSSCNENTMNLLLGERFKIVLYPFTFKRASRGRHLSGFWILLIFHLIDMATIKIK